MSDFQGYEYKNCAKPTYVPPQETEDEKKKSKINISLEEVIYQSKKKKREEKNPEKRKDIDEWRGDDESDDEYKLKSDKRVQAINLHVPREEVLKLCKSLNIETKGYFVKMEAVLTKHRSH